MLTVTERAAQELRAILVANATDPKQALRLQADASGLFMGLDWQQEGDEVVDSEGSAILLMTPELSLALADATIDCIDTTDGPRLTIGTQEAHSHEEPSEE
jgi:Fe-S cluster assembly iron-binding protein IscA